MIAAVSSVFAMIFMLFFDSILANRLLNKFQIPVHESGYIFALGAFAYAVSSPFVGMLCKVV